MQIASLPHALLLYVIVMIAAWQATASAETSDAGNTYLAGGDLKIVRPATGDLFAAGGRVSVEGDVGADAAIAGGTVDIRAPVMQDLRVAAGTVNINKAIGGDLVAAGGTVRVEPAAIISGSAWLGGGEVSVDGKIGRGAKIYGNKITLAGEIVGDTHLYGKQIVLTPTARIEGNLSYASPVEFPENQRSQVSGAITRVETPERWNATRAGGAAFSWFHPIFLVSMLICGMLLYMLFPNAVVGAEQAMEQYPVRSLLTGLVLLFIVPPLAILFMVTVIGLPIGFALLLLYPLTLLLGYLATAFFLGKKLAVAMKHTGRLSLKKQTIFLALALLILSLALAIPFLGGFILMLAIVTGVGGWAVWTQRKLQSARHAPEGG